MVRGSRFNSRSTMDFSPLNNYSVRQFRTMLTTLLCDQEVLGSIPGSVVRLYSIGELFHGMYRFQKGFQ